MNEKHFILQNPEDIEKKSAKESQELYGLKKEKERKQYEINKLVKDIEKLKEKDPTHFDITKMEKQKKILKERLEEIEQQIAEIIK